MTPITARFQSFGLEKKFILLAAGTVVVALGLTSVGLLVHEYGSLRNEMPRAIGGAADLLAHNCAAALAFHDVEAAHEALASIVSMPEIRTAWVTTPDGRPFAAFSTSTVGPPPIGIVGSRRYVYDAQSLYVSAPVMLASERVGTVYLEASLEQFWARVFFGAAVIGIIAVSSFLVASYLASRLFRVLTLPLQRLSETMRAVSMRNDYTLRAPVFAVQDEISQLISGFNSMLDRVEERDAEIRRGRVILESILEGTSPLTGDDFCRKLAELLGEHLAAEAVAVWEIPEASETRGRLCGGWSRDARAWPREWAARGTMLEEFLGARAPVLFSAQSERFTGDPVLPAFGGRGGFAVPLISAANEALGAIVLIGSGPVEDLAFRESIVTIFAARTAAELERMRTERLKNDFLGMVSHEIRTPLAILQATADGFASGGDAERSEERRRKLSEIWSRNLKRLSSVIRNLLDLSRLESDAVRLHIEEFDLAATADHVVESFIAAATDRQVMLELECGPGACLMSGDEELMTQVLTNLIDNALRFARSRIRVTVEKAGSGGVRVAVWNDGPKIPEYEMEAIFDKFHQVRRPVGGRGYKGVGLGLAICRRDVDLHGGTIQVENVGGGVRFIVTIPARGGVTADFIPGPAPGLEAVPPTTRMSAFGGAAGTADVPSASPKRAGRSS